MLPSFAQSVLASRYEKREETADPVLILPAGDEPERVLDRARQVPLRRQDAVTLGRHRRADLGDPDRRVGVVVADHDLAQKRQHARERVVVRVVGLLRQQIRPVVRVVRDGVEVVAAVDLVQAVEEVDRRQIAVAGLARRRATGDHHDRRVDLLDRVVCRDEKLRRTRRRRLPFPRSTASSARSTPRTPGSLRGSAGRPRRRTGRTRARLRRVLLRRSLRPRPLRREVEDAEHREAVGRGAASTRRSTERQRYTPRRRSTSGQRTSMRTHSAPAVAPSPACGARACGRCRRGCRSLR